MIARFGVPDAAQAPNYINNIHPAACTEDAINARNTTGNFDAVALRQAACGDQHLAAFLFGSQLGEHIERLLLSQANETAGVDDQEARPARVSDKLIARTGQQLRHGIRVNGILSTAERDYVKCFLAHTVSFNLIILSTVSEADGLIISHSIRLEFDENNPIAVEGIYFK